MSILLIDNYDSFTYNLYQMVQALTKTPVEVYRNDALSIEEIESLRPERVILSPGPGHPAKAKDFGVCKEVLNAAEKLGVPILGVCLGHQGIVHHFGGNVVQAPVICHGKTSAIGIRQDHHGVSPLLEGLPNPFQAMRYHSLVAAEGTFPECLQVTAREIVHGLIMALEHKRLPIYGVQFHPESIGTPHGSQILRNFLEKCHSPLPA